MLGRQEALLLYHLARDHFLGYGEIIDAGAFLGCSAYCLSKGVEENSRIAGKSGRIHSYDLFQLWTEPGVDKDAMSDFLYHTYGVETAGQESTFHLFSANLGQLARHVRIHQGNILDKGWSGRPIEILFIDICKTKEIWQHVIKTFFRSLIPGLSIIVHQDWHHAALPYLHVAQEYMADYFEIVEHKANDSAAFRLIDRIPDNVLDNAAAYNFSAVEQIALIDRVIERFAGRSRFLKLLKAEFLRRQGNPREALHLVEDTFDYHGESMSVDEAQYFAGNVDGVAMASSRDLAQITAAGNFDANIYIENRPDIIAALGTGRFENAFHHYIRFNARKFLST